MRKLLPSLAVASLLAFGAQAAPPLGDSFTFFVPPSNATGNNTAFVYLHNPNRASGNSGDAYYTVVAETLESAGSDCPGIAGGINSFNLTASTTDHCGFTSGLGSPVPIRLMEGLTDYWQIPMGTLFGGKRFTISYVIAGPAGANIPGGSLSGGGTPAPPNTGSVSHLQAQLIIPNVGGGTGWADVTILTRDSLR